MKRKIIFIALILILIVSLSSCTIHPFMFVKKGEFPEKCIRAYIMGSGYEIEVGETFDDFVMFIPYEAFGYTDLDWARQHTDVEITVDHPDIVEIVDYDAQEILDTKQWGGLTIKGLKPGVATITVTCIYVPTGGRSRPEPCVITVVDPAETEATEAETAP